MQRSKRNRDDRPWRGSTTPSTSCSSTTVSAIRTDLHVLEALRRREPDVLVIVLTAYSNVETAVAVMKQGAYHYVTKPFNLDEIALLVGKALETTRLRRELRTIRASQREPYSLDRIIGDSPAVAEVKTLLGKVASSPASTVLLTGESGTGKDLAAKVIHYTSARAARPFMNITCSALTESLLESQLFGHERGAFTDAKQQKRGLLESADGGTVFLDEIGEMALPLQSKLLRFLEEKTFKRVGGAADIGVDVRIIAATNQNLAEKARDGTFREDLFYRLDVLPVKLPPLRERADDVPVLVRFFVDGFNREFRKRVQDVAPEALEALQSHTWPGNVRELRNVVERAVLLSEGNRLTERDFPMLRARDGLPTGSPCRRREPTWRPSSVTCSCRPWNEPAGIRPGPRRCSGSTGTRSVIESRSSRLQGRFRLLGAVPLPHREDRYVGQATDTLGHAANEHPLGSGHRE